MFFLLMLGISSCLFTYRTADQRMKVSWVCVISMRGRYAMALTLKFKYFIVYISFLIKIIHVYTKLIKLIIEIYNHII